MKNSNKTSIENHEIEDVNYHDNYIAPRFCEDDLDAHDVIDNSLRRAQAITQLVSFWLLPDNAATAALLPKDGILNVALDGALAHLAVAHETLDQSNVTLRKTRAAKEQKR